MTVNEVGVRRGNPGLNRSTQHSFGTVARAGYGRTLWVAEAMFRVVAQPNDGDAKEDE